VPGQPHRGDGSAGGVEEHGLGHGVSRVDTEHQFTLHATDRPTGWTGVPDHPSFHLTLQVSEPTFNLKSQLRRSTSQVDFSGRFLREPDDEPDGPVDWSRKEQP
jgi:hypothetical protein